METETVNPNRQRTLAARRAFAAQFPTPEARIEFYRELGRRSAAGRVVLSGAEAAALLAAAPSLPESITAKLQKAREAVADAAV